MKSVTVGNQKYTIGDYEELVMARCLKCGHHELAAISVLPGALVDPTEQLRADGVTCPKCGSREISA